MSQFNTQKTTVQATTTNLTGDRAYPQKDSHAELFALVATNILADKYYQSNDQTVSNIIACIKKCDPVFVMKLAVYARTELNLRSIPVVLIIQLQKHLYSQRTAVSKEIKAMLTVAVFKTVCRVDDITEYLAYYKFANGHSKLNKISKVLQKSLASSFHKFDEYQFAKYQGKNKDVSLRDAMFICRPVPATEDQVRLFFKLANSELDIPVTHETLLSSVGADADKKKEAWTKLIQDKDLGYMATLRNLNNMVRSGVDVEDLDRVCQYLSNPTAVKHSKQLPFRFYSAYNSLDTLNPVIKTKLQNAIYEAAKISLSNMTLLDQNETVFAVADVSDSMMNRISNNSSLCADEISMFYTGMMAHMNPNCLLGYFGTDFVMANKRDVNPFNCRSTRSSVARKTGHGTCPDKIFEHLMRNGIKVDKIFIFSDLQFWSSATSLHTALTGSSGHTAFQNKLNEYRRTINPELKVVLIDLRGYGGGVPVKQDSRTTIISGFSDKTFQYGDADHMLEEVDRVEL